MYYLRLVHFFKVMIISIWLCHHWWPGRLWMSIRARCGNICDPGQVFSLQTPSHLSVLPLMILALCSPGHQLKFSQEKTLIGRLGEDEFLKVKFSSEASGCSLRARIIGRLHKITASELNKRTIKHIFITHEYSKIIFPNPGWHICFYLWSRFISWNIYYKEH